MLNVINGGVHAQNSIDFQEFMVVPAGASSFAEALRIGAETYHALKALLHERGLATAVGDEGGFAPDLPVRRGRDRGDPRGGRAAGHADRVAIALDPASSEFFRDGAYHVEGRELDTGELVDLYDSLAERFPLVSIEDGLAEDEWGRLEDADRDDSATGSSSSATTSSSPTSSGCAAASTRASPTRS